MDSWISLQQLQAWKPVLTALVLPPLPLLALIVIGMAVARSRRGLAWTLVLASTGALWLSTTMVAGEALGDVLTPSPPPALSIERIREIRTRAAARQPIAIVVLGGGRETLAPEFAEPNLSENSMARLRYGVWLSRETGVPLGFSGGVGWGEKLQGPSEAEIAARIARQEFGRPLRWIEGTSRDTAENASNMVAMLKADGIQEAVLVTHGWHMPRALRAFRGAAAGALAVTPAPMGLAHADERGVLHWLPSAEGFSRVRRVLRESLGRIVAGGTHAGVEHGP